MNDKTYIIPHNYKENGKIFGMFEKHSAFIAAAITFASGYFILRLPVSLKIKLIAFSFTLPLSWITLVFFDRETIIDFLMILLRWSQLKKIYLYKGRGDKFD